MAMRTWARAVIFLAALWAFIPAAASAQTPLFSEETELQFAIDAPLSDLVRAAPRSMDPFPATLTLAGAGEPRRFEIELSPRGISRRTLGICTFPPLRLNLLGPRQGTVLQGQNKIKLVTRCRSGANYEQFTVLEYTAYRLYNVITPLSFRVRPVRVTYRDTRRRRREETQLNFVIEDVDDLARRNGRTALDVQTNEVRSNQLDPEHAALFSMFQFMIGNLDWDMTQSHADEECCHNGKLLAATAATRENVIPVPYDFDYSGFVDTPYAMPPEGIPVRNVRTRHYRGLCRFNDQARAAAEVFRSRRERLYAVIDGEARLVAARRQGARRYLEDFFEILDNPARFERQIIENCRG
ncbi:MAG: hypothetical protein ACT4OF_04220 [Caulobacteraceae bacterium]